MPRKRAKWPMELILGEEESEFHKQDQGIQDQDRDLLTEETGTGDTEETLIEVTAETMTEDQGTNKNKFRQPIVG